MNKYLFIFFSFCALSCTKKVYLKKIESYLNASTVEAKSKLMAEDYRSFFAEKKGAGKDKQTALRSFSEWDAPMHPDIEILNYSVDGDTYTVHFNEENQFTKLIGYPGWKGTGQFRFDANKMIKEFIYIPDDSNPSYTPYLKPALDWLQKNMPNELNEVYRNKQLVQTKEAAKKWVVLLTSWKERTK